MFYLIGMLVIINLPADVKAANIGVQVCTPVSASVLLEPATDQETEDSSIQLSGTAPASSTVYAFRNDQQVGFVMAATDGTYSLSASLVVGTNVLKTATKNDCSEPYYSGSITVTRKSSPVPAQPEDPAPQPPASVPSRQGTGILSPDLPADGSEEVPPVLPDGSPVIVSPQSGVKVFTPMLLITGRTLPLLTVALRVNDQLVAEVQSDDKGDFRAQVSLQEGINTLVATVIGPVGERSSEIITVEYRNRQQAIVSERAVPKEVAITAAVLAGSAATFAVLTHLGATNWLWSLLTKLLRK